MLTIINGARPRVELRSSTLLVCTHERKTFTCACQGEGDRKRERERESERKKRGGRQKGGREDRGAERREIDGEDGEAQGERIERRLLSRRDGRCADITDK